MISFLFASAGLLNLLFYIFAVGFIISLLLEQWLKFRPLSVDSTMNERNMYIVQSNRKYCWRQAWITNIYWFLCNVGLYVISRNMQTPSDTFFQRNPLQIRKDAFKRGNGFGPKNNVFQSDINCVDAAIKWLSKKKNHNKTPWILLLNILKPHFPHLVTKDLWELYDSYEDVHKYNKNCI